MGFHRLWLVVCHQQLITAKPGKEEAIQPRLSLETVFCVSMTSVALKRAIEVGDMQVRAQGQTQQLANQPREVCGAQG